MSIGHFGSILLLPVIKPPSRRTTAFPTTSYVRNCYRGPPLSGDVRPQNDIRQSGDQIAVRHQQAVEATGDGNRARGPTTCSAPTTPRVTPKRGYRMRARRYTEGGHVFVGHATELMGESAQFLRAP